MEKRPQTNQVPIVKVVLLGNSGVGKTSLALRFVKDTFHHPYPEPTIGTSFFTKEIEIDTRTCVDAHTCTSDYIDISIGNDTINTKANTNTTTANNNNSHDENDDDDDDDYEYKYTYTSSTKKRIKFNIWDTAGQEKYHSLVPMYYRGSQVAILIYDVCSIESFYSLKSWVNELQSLNQHTSKLKKPQQRSHEHTSTSTSTSNNMHQSYSTSYATSASTTSHERQQGLVIVICGNKSDLDMDRQVDTNVAMQYAETINALYYETSAKDGTNVDSIFASIGRKIFERIEGGYQTIETELIGMEDDGVVGLDLATNHPRSGCRC